LKRTDTERHVVLKQIGHLGDLPKEVPSEADKNEDFLRKAHHVLLEVILKYQYYTLHGTVLIL